MPPGECQTITGLKKRKEVVQNAGKGWKSAQISMDNFLLTESVVIFIMYTVPLQLSTEFLHRVFSTGGTAPGRNGTPYFSGGLTMHSRKVLTLLMALCLLVSVLSPAAYALGTGTEAYTGSVQQSAEVGDTHSSDPRESSLVASGQGAVSGPLSMRDETNRPDTASDDDTAQTGTWTARPVDGTGLSSLSDARLPDSIQELRDAAQFYNDDDVVAAFIVMEEQPLAERYATLSLVPASETRGLVSRQDAVLRSISKAVPQCRDMEVRYQFTYLTNAISVRVPFGALEEIAGVEGVASVYLMPVYSPCETDVADPNTMNSSVATGVATVWEDLGYTGTGMKIAVIDSGLDLDHPSFAADPATNENSMTQADVAAVLGKLNASARMRAVTAGDLYYSVKVPFAFNYVDSNLNADHSHDTQGYHGTHVAGIAAANKVEGVDVVGMAPDAQIIVMKVFGVNGGAYTDDILAALEDAMTLNCDVVNLSLGSPAVFSSEHPEIDAIYGRIAKQDMIVNISSGNEDVSSTNNLWGTDLNRTANPDNATVGSPAVYKNTTVVASAENSAIMSSFFTVGDEKVAYIESEGLSVTFDTLGFEALAYVLVGGLGKAEDFEAVDVEGKIAVVSRGEISVAQKLANAEAAGAIGMVVYNNVSGTIAMAMTDDSGELPEGVSGLVPAVSVSMAAGEILKSAETKTLTVSPEEGIVASEEGGQMSEFSSWGVSPDLHLVPDITGIGGNVYSTIDGGEYGLMSGTSMSSPQLAGISALVLQYVHETYPDLSDADTRTLADSLIMCTADPIVSNVSGVEASPRQQGAGLVNAADAITSGAYLSVSGSSKPKAELGDDPDRTGEYTFRFFIRNLTDADKTYTLDASLLTEDIVTYGGYDFMAGYDRALEGEVRFSRDTVTVAAGSIAAVTATVTLSDGDKAWLDTHYENGGYVEGFVYLHSTDADGVDLGLPFLGFYGDWTEAPVLDGGFWYDEMFWAEEWEDVPTGEQYFNIPWTSLGGVDWVLGLNPYTGTFDGFDADHFIISNNGDGYVDGLSEIYFSLLRNAKNLTLTFSDGDTGEIYDSRSLSYTSKTMYISAYGTMVPTVYSWWYDDIYAFTDGAGWDLPNGTRVNMTVYANLDYSVHSQNNDFNTWIVPITVDTEAPTLLGIESVATAEGNFIRVTASDNTAIAGIQLVNPTGTRLVGDYSGAGKNADGTYTVTMDVTGLGTELILILGDYGANESAWALTYTLDDNRPEMDTSKLYGYRLFDADIYSDSMYGWVSIDPETTDVETQTSDSMEYYALTAAEYAGGYVFAVDAGYNLVVMVPGLWNRTTICNLGVNVLDMTFDKTTGTMYLLTKESYYISLYTVDLLTGELTLARYFGYTGPWSIAAADDGTIYAIQSYSNKLYTLDRENNYQMVALTDDEGNEITFTNSDGGMVSPGYSQSMTYCSADGRLYWAYYPSSGYYGVPALFTIDPETYAYTCVPFAVNSEYAGLLTLEDGVADYNCDGGECPSARFTDVAMGTYYHEGVDYTVANGYMKGTGETTFEPYATMTRGMMVTVLYRMAGEPEITTPNTFPDSDGFFYDAISWAAETGICNGFPDGTFRPYDSLTRAQMVTFLYRFAAYMGCDVVGQFDSLARFTDADAVSDYARSAMRWAVGVGLITGVAEDVLAPNETALRGQAATVLYRLYRNVMGGWRLPVNQPLSGILLSDTELLMTVDTTAYVSVSPIPWNTGLGEVTWTSSDPKVATVAGGVITAVSDGSAVITATVGELSEQCLVDVVTISGSVYAYDFFNNAGTYGDWIHMDLDSLPGYDSMFQTPVDFIAAEYNGHDGCIYGYDANCQFYRFNPDTGSVMALGDPLTGVQILDMAYDYSTGFMYAATMNVATSAAAIDYVNLNTGALVELGQSGSYSIYMTLACSTDGQLYAVTYDGSLLAIGEGFYDDWSGATYLEEEVLIEGLGELAYGQSMTYDHDNGTLIWACPEKASLIWMDPETGNVVNLGDPTGSGLFQFYGMFTIPSTIPALSQVDVEDLEVEDLLVMTGQSKSAKFTVSPLNATNQEIFWASSDLTVATVNSDGVVTGRSVGKAEITATLIDGENTFERTFTVTVVEAADNLYGYVLSDLASYGGDFWVELHDSDTGNVEILGISDYTLYSEEYYQGKLYAYGYDPNDWEANFQFMVLDAKTYTVESMTDMGETFPWVYDMTYDYASSTLYATAGYNETETALYIVDMNSGTLIPLMDPEVNFMSIAADGRGNLYGISRSVEYSDWDTGEFGFTDAELYRIDPEAGTCELVGSTGMQCNMIASMAFDYDTGNLYWAQLYRQDFFSPINGGLCIVDTETGAASFLGIIGTAGCQVAGMYVIADNFPEEPAPALTKVMLSESSKVLSLGETAAISAYGLPISVGGQAEWSWASSDEDVVTVDENGNVTAVAQGTADITVTATFDGVSKSAVCHVTVLSADACFITYSTSYNGFVKIDRKDYTQTELLSEDEDAPVLSMAFVGDTIYGYDVDGGFFSTDETTFQRTYLGSHGVEVETEGGYSFDVRDLAYDSVTGKLLALGCTSYTDEWGYHMEITGGCRIYEVNLTDGSLTELCVLEDMSQVRGMTVDTEGTVYVYQAFTGGFSTVDLATGICTDFAPTYTLSLYGSDEDVLSLDYDPISKCIYLLYTGNGSYYQMVVCDTVSRAATLLGNVGEVYYDDWTWSYVGETFNGLLIKN